MRSEDVSVRPVDDEPAHAIGMAGVVDFVETLGNEALVSVRLGAGSADGEASVVVARCETRRALEAGARVRCTFDAAHTHVFDAASGVALSGGTAAR